jgi:hypothetical protein
MTPLHVAAERAHNDVMEVLHKHGAKVSRHSAQGNQLPSVLGPQELILVRKGSYCVVLCLKS